MTNTTTAPLGALVREKREGLHLSMDELAMRARVSRSSIHRIEHSHATRPTPAKLAQVLTVVDITPDEVRSVLDDDEYIGDVLHWMERSGAIDAVRRQLQPSGPMRPLDEASKPDLIAIHGENGGMARIYSNGHVDELSAVLRQAGWLVTRPD
jgi:transcriptional regulator with XRE-family HTH domain